MDKYEYKVRAEEIKSLIAEGEYAEAVKIADTIDWRRVKSVMMLCTISDLYKINRRFEESRDILLMAYERHPGGRLIVYSLCELSIKMGETVPAIEYYKEFVQIAPKDTGRYILQYKLYEAQDVSLEERIAVLEEFKKRDYREKWAYELAYLYHRVGLETKCVEECDEMVLWFGEGRYVIKALELKQLHQPLTPDQQDKYDMLKAAHEQPEQYWEDAPQESGEETEETEETASAYEEDGEEFRVKTVDVGQYNTVNLQKELAESMKEILGDTQEDRSGQEEGPSMGPITEAIVAPLLEETGEIAGAGRRVTPFTQWPEQEEKESAPARVPLQSAPTQTAAAAPAPVQQIPAQAAVNASGQTATPSTEEVFFEDVKDVLLEDTKEISIGEAQPGQLGDTKELNPKRRIIYPVTAGPSGTGPAFAATPGSSGTNAGYAVTAGPSATGLTTAAAGQPGVTQLPHMVNHIKPSGFEQLLSQEYDGQIRLVVPERGQVEKQITGQMNINDILAEWERMKKENEEKRREDVRNRVKQHTGNLFSEFDEATKTDLLEQMEKAVVEAILKESGKESIDPEDITPKKVSDIVRSVKRENKELEFKKAEPEKAASAQEQTAEQEAAGTLSEIPSTAKQPEEIAGEADIISLEETDEAAPPQEKDAVNVRSMVEDANRQRELSEEEKELFGRFIHNRKAKQQIIHAVDTVSMDSYTDNVIVTGEEGAGSLELAKGLIRMLQMSDANFSGKVARISGDTLNKKDVEATLSRLVDGALIVERASAIKGETAVSLNRTLSKENSGLLVILEDKKEAMNKFLDRNPVLTENFNARIDIEALDDHSLVEYARQYAEAEEYSIDELGILALHTRIADMQTSDHEVTVAEVRELVDDAIYFADRKNPKHFFDILFGKRYDEEDRIILREKDFMHY